ncbi:hypothetical protein [Novosphingobium sp. ST904]|uniref:hypothetical protein n=1 Tax=Novosphingobium sp. ST904 TaxID=1684385 RepID=UPI0006C8AD3C|nr:hypothetical protein [Novosphingobium sp. ST904]KPH68605.1 hypothetical protein ADT71_01010 [Novosphingobium sp. ST904]TCM23029.1 hypothetical protein EDF59_1601 [Novosphingobium sp. ST904]
MKKGFFSGVLATYLFIALVGGLAMKTVLPALNPLGVAYVGLTWPVAMTCVALDNRCSAIPPSQYVRIR